MKHKSAFSISFPTQLIATVINHRQKLNGFLGEKFNAKMAYLTN